MVVSTTNKRLSITFMLITIAIILIVLCLLGVITSYTLGGFIYILLVVGVVLIIVRLLQSKKVL